METAAWIHEIQQAPLRCPEDFPLGGQREQATVPFGILDSRSPSITRQSVSEVADVHVVRLDWLQRHEQLLVRAPLQHRPLRDTLGRCTVSRRPRSLPR